MLLEAGLGLGPYQDPLTGSHHPILEAFRTEGPARVFDRVAETPGDRVLLSVEQLSTDMLDRAQAEAWRDAARTHFNVKVVLFLRRQDYLKESVFSQIVKNWYAGSILDDHHYEYDYDRRVALLEDVFGADNVTVLIYRDPGPNDIVGDLLGALGVAVDRDRMTPIAAQNVSTSRRKVLFQSQVPKSRQTEVDARARALPSFVAAAVAETPAIADDGERFLMSPQQRHDLVARHLAGNRAVLARHGIVQAEGFPRASRPRRTLEPAGTDHPRRGAGCLAVRARRLPARPQPAGSGAPVGPGDATLRRNAPAAARRARRSRRSGAALPARGAVRSGGTLRIGQLIRKILRRFQKIVGLGSGRDAWRPTRIALRPAESRGAQHQPRLPHCRPRPELLQATTVRGTRSRQVVAAPILHARSAIGPG